jgi:hypothetical protein
VTSATHPKRRQFPTVEVSAVQAQELPECEVSADYPERRPFPTFGLDGPRSGSSAHSWHPPRTINVGTSPPTAIQPVIKFNYLQIRAVIPGEVPTQNSISTSEGKHPWGSADTPIWGSADTTRVIPGEVPTRAIKDTNKIQIVSVGTSPSCNRIRVSASLCAAMES